MSLPERLARALRPDYLVRGELGEGAAGWVVHAQDAHLGREVALKVARKRGTPQQLARFEREGRIAGGLQHTNIVRLHSMGSVEGHPYLVLELVPGAQTLRETFESAPVLARLNALSDVAAAMAYAHEQGIVHRDLKPENVLVDAMGRGRVTDFGVATMRGLDRMTQSGVLVGTPYYMAPEQLTSTRENVGPHTDVWALGVMLYEAVHGERPFSGDTLFELASQVSRGAPKRALLPGAPPALLGVVACALARRGRDRYPHAGAFGRALESALAGRAPEVWRRAPLLATGIAALVLVCAGLTWAAVGGDAPPSGLPEGGHSQPNPNSPRARWEQLEATLQGAELVLAGEAWLEDFPSDPLRKQVARALREARLTAPRWVHSKQHGRVLLTSTKTRLAAIDGEGTFSIREWGEPKAWTLEFDGPGLSALVGSPLRDYLWVAGTHEGDELLMRLKDGEGQGTFDYDGKPVTHRPALLAWSSDATLVAATNGHRASVFSCEDLLKDDAVSLIRGWLHQDQTTVGLVFLDDSSALAAVSGEGREDLLDQLLILNLTEYTIQGQVDMPTVPTCLVALPGARLLVGTRSGHLLIYDGQAHYQGALTDPKLSKQGPAESVADVYATRASRGAVHGLAVSPKGLLYSVVSGGADSRSEIRVWDLDGKALFRTQRVSRPYRACCLSADGRYLACATEDGTIEVWDRWVEGEWRP